MARAESDAAIMRSGRVSARKSLRAGALVVIAALSGVLPAVAAAGASTATNAVSSSVVPGWSAWVSSPTDSARRLATAAPSTSPATATIQVRTGTREQTWLGVGGALTDASTSILGASDEATRLLFDPQRADGAHLNLVRLPLSATDFSTSPWTFDWNDTSGTLTAPQQALSQLSVLTDRLMPLQGQLAVVATPWTAPAAMKDSAALNGGALLGGSVPAYGRMLGAQAAWLRRHGVPLMAMTLGNEPYFSSSGLGGYPSMLMSDSQQMTLADEVAPALANAGVELWAVDHNWSDRAHYDAVEAGSNHRFQASAFHCYGGSPNQMSGVRERPVVTECTGTNDGFAGTFRWDAMNLVISAVESGSVGLVLWNLALNEQHGPHTNGCSTCRGVVDVNSLSGSVTKNPEFFTLAQLARAADPGAVVIGTDPVAGLPHVAFLEPDGGVGMFAYNDTGSDQVVEVGIDGDPTGSRFVVPAGNLLTIRGAGSLVPGSVTLPTDGPEVGVSFAPIVGTWSPTPTQMSYQWLADGAPVTGATSPAITPTSAQAGRTLALRVTASRPGYAASTVTSAASSAVLASQSTVRNLLPPAVVGQPAVGRTLYVSPGEWSPADVTVTFQWQRAGQPIAGATSSAYRLTAADLARTISVVVWAQAGPSGPSTAVTAALSDPVRPGQFVVLHGGRLVGRAMPAGLLSLADLRVRPSTAFQYAWLRDGKHVGPPRGARSSYRVQRRDVGHRISLRVSISAPGYRARTFTFATVIRRNDGRL